MNAWLTLRPNFLYRDAALQQDRRCDVVGVGLGCFLSAATSSASAVSLAFISFIIAINSFISDIFAEKFLERLREITHY